MLFLLFLFLFVYFHLITRKKNVIQFWDFKMNEFEFSWSQKYSKIFLSFSKLFSIGHLIMFVINCFVVALLETTWMTIYYLRQFAKWVLFWARFAKWVHRLEMGFNFWGSLAVYFLCRCTDFGVWIWVLFCYGYCAWKY